MNISDSFDLCSTRLLHVRSRSDCGLFQPLLWHLCRHRGQRSSFGRRPERQPLRQDSHRGDLRQRHRPVWCYCSHSAGEWVRLRVVLSWFFLSFREESMRNVGAKQSVDTQPDARLCLDKHFKKCSGSGRVGWALFDWFPAPPSHTACACNWGKHQAWIRFRK